MLFKTAEQTQPLPQATLPQPDAGATFLAKSRWPKAGEIIGLGGSVGFEARERRQFFGVVTGALVRGKYSGRRSGLSLLADLSEIRCHYS